MEKSQKLYRVLFKGVIYPGFDKTQVINNIHELTKVPVDIISRKFFSGKTVVIRRADNESYAQQLHKMFTEAGIETTIEEVMLESAEEIAEEIAEDEEMLVDLPDTIRQKSGNVFKPVYTVPIVFAVLLILSFVLFSTDEEDSSIVTSDKKALELTTPAQEKPPTQDQATTKTDDITIKQPIAADISPAKEHSQALVADSVQEDSHSADSGLLSQSKPDRETGILEQMLPEPSDTVTETAAAQADDKTEKSGDDLKPQLQPQEQSINSTESVVTDSTGASVPATEKQDAVPIVVQPIAEQEGENLFADYTYGHLPLDISTDELRVLLDKENPKFKDYSGKKNIKLLTPDDTTEIIKTDEEESLQLVKIGDIFYITKNQEIVSISLDSTFLFSDKPYIQGSYNLRVFPVIKQRFPLFLSKFIDNFSDKDGTWWNKYIEPLKDHNEGQTIRIVGNKYTIIINYIPKVSVFSDFSLSDYASKTIYNDRLSVTLIRTSP